MRADFYGGPLDGRTWNVEKRRFIHVPVVEKPQPFFVTYHVKAVQAYSYHRYELAVEYPDRLIYISRDDSDMQVLWVLLAGCAGRTQSGFCYWAEGRYMGYLASTGIDWSEPGREFYAAVERRMRKTRRKRKSAEKNDPQ